MNYCTIENIQELIPTTVLSQLTNGDEFAITKAITDATASINAYLQGSYDLSELENIPVLTDICQKISVYNLYTRVSGDETPQIVSTNYNIAISELEKIQTGKLSLGLSDGSISNRQSEILTNKTGVKTFSQDTLAGF